MDKTSVQAVLPHPRGHLAYYGLRDTPFGATVGPRPLWLGRTHREALATLTAAIRDGDGGLFLLTGDVGTGKTGLVNRLIGTLSGDRLVIGRIPGPIFDVSELVQAVADAFGIQGKWPSGPAVATHVGELLGRAGSPGQKALLILDEAQNLSDELLLTVFELSSVGTSQGYPLAILLVGESELGDELAKDHHAGLRQRIITRCVLEPLSEEEVGEYIRSCLEIAGAEEMIFDRDAVRQIASISRGAPGVINVVCERALVAGYWRQARVIGRGIIDDCLAERGPRDIDGADDGGARDGGIERRGADVSELPRDAPRRSRATLWPPVLAAVMLGIAGYSLYAGWFDQIRANVSRGALRDSPVERPGPESTVATTPSLAIGGNEKRGGKAEAPIASPDNVGPRPAADGDRRQRDRAMAPAASPLAREDAMPQQAPAREEGRLPAIGGEAEAHDPGAVIDWLLKESGKR